MAVNEKNQISAIFEKVFDFNVSTPNHILQPSLLVIYATLKLIHDGYTTTKDTLSIPLQKKSEIKSGKMARDSQFEIAL